LAIILSATTNVDAKSNRHTERSVAQCIGQPNGVSCQRDCPHPSCSAAKCCNGFCRKGITYEKFCVRHKFNQRPDQCVGRRTEAPCSIGGCCQDQCMTVENYRAVCEEGQPASYVPQPYPAPQPRPPVKESIRQRSVAQCHDKPNGFSCQRGCKLPDCSASKCCNGFCRRGIVYENFCVKHKFNRGPDQCKNHRWESPCSIGGCCQGLCMTVDRYRAVCEKPRPPVTQPHPVTQPYFVDPPYPVTQPHPVTQAPYVDPNYVGEWNYVDEPY